MDGRYLIFESFVFDRLRGTLTRGESPIALTPKALELLALFLERPRELLTKEMLLEALWPGEFVQEGNLSQQVYLLRKSLAAFGKGGLILTVPRRGYRFAAEVWSAEAADVPPEVPTLDRRRRSFGVLRTAAAVALVVAVGAGASLAYRSAQPHGLRGAISTLPPTAQRAYRLGRYYFDKVPFKEMSLAQADFREVTRLAPRSALGYAGLADIELRVAQLTLGDTRRAHVNAGRDYALQALRAGPASAEAHVSYGCYLDWYGHSPKAAAHEFETAIALEPNSAPAHLWYGIQTLYSGDFTRSIAELREASRLDPTSFLTWRSLGVAYYYSGRYAEAVAPFQQALAIYPGSVLSRLHIAMALEQSGHAERALAILKHFTSKDFNRVQLRTWIAYCRAKEGDRAAAVVEADRIAHSPERNLVAPSSLAAVYVAAGETQQAVAVLEKANMNVLTMWSPPESAALLPRYDPRLALLYREGRLQDAR